ncbi:phage tail tip fiber protein, partial [Pseudomonas antarctica]|uniref:phage tail tip fiber protein n=1 Tax=Pseudomonas antarctica TaxID=219572 RepID=UPI00387AD70C
RADTFMLLNLNNGTPVSPFSVSGGQTFVSSAFIQDGTITNAKIGEYISSTNYISGQQGWILKKDGSFEINGLVPGQGRSMMTNRSMRFWDVNNVKRVQ